MRLLPTAILLLLAMPAVAQETAPPAAVAPTALERRMAEHLARLDADVAKLKKENEALLERIANLEAAAAAAPQKHRAVAVNRLSREDFERRFAHMDADEIQKRLGKPNSHRKVLAVDDQYGVDRDEWTYNGLTFDKVTGKPDRAGVIWVEWAQTRRDQPPPRGWRPHQIAASFFYIAD